MPHTHLLSNNNASSSSQQPSEIHNSGSKINKATVKINFRDLKDANLHHSQITLGTDDQLRDFHHDQAVNYLNSATQKGYLLPLRQMNLILLKFRSNRYGELRDAEKLYFYIHSNCHVGNPTEDWDNTHREMMQIYINLVDQENVQKLFFKNF